MKQMKSFPGIIGLCLTTITFVPLPISAQQVEPPPDLWLIRAQAITESLVKDAAALTSFDQAILFARLGDAWWKDGPERARSWMQKAVEAVESVPNRENDSERSQRLNAARVLLSIIDPRDKKLSLRLTEVLTSEAERASGAARNLNADAIVEEALAVLDLDPQRAATLGTASLRVGRPTIIASLLWKLRARDSKLADALFLQAIGAMRETYDTGFALSLLRVAFPGSAGPGDADIPPPPDPLRTELLQALLAYFQQSLSTNGQAAFCTSNGSTIFRIAPFLSQFDHLLPPEQSATLRQWITACQPLLPPATEQRIDDAQRNFTPRTVDDFLDAAERAKDLSSQTLLRAQAARLAANQNNFDRAISIIDEMDSDARKFLGGAWSIWRFDWAASSASEHLKRGDPAGAQRVIADVPTNLRPAAQITLAYKLSPTRDYRLMVVGLIEDARKGLPASDLPDTEKINWYLTLVRLYAKLLPAEADDVLKETVAALNHLKSNKSSGSDDSSANEKSELSGEIGLYNLPLSLLENNELAFSEAISAIDSPTKRALIRLGLLNASLERHRASSEARQKVSKETKN